MLYYEEAIQELECQGGHREQVEGDDHLAVILEEGTSADLNYPDDEFAAGIEPRSVPTARNRAFAVLRGSLGHPSPHSLLPSGG
jgi:hypothetical protein